MSHSQISLEQLAAQINEKMTKTILALESDEVIEQMRNDKTLYQFKLVRIKEIIEEYFDFTAQLAHLLKQNQELAQNLATLEQKMAAKDQEFSSAIDMIEESAKKHTHLKEQQISRLTATIRELQLSLNSKSDAAEKNSKKVSELAELTQQLQHGNEKLKKEVSRMKEENGRLAELNKKYQISQKSAEAEHERSMAALKSEYQKQIQQCQNLMKKMQNDMLTIKNQWQKRCSEVQKGLREFYEAELLKLEQKKARELIQHIEAMKEGRPVIIKQDQEILNTRVESVRRQYENEIEKLQKSKSQLQDTLENLQSVQISRMKQIQARLEAEKSMKSEHEAEKAEWSAQREKLRRDSEKLKAIVLELQRNSKDVMFCVEAKESQVVKLHDNIKFVEKKLEIANRNLVEQKNLSTTQEYEIDRLKARCQGLEESENKSKKSLENLELEIQSKVKRIQSLGNELDELNQKNAELSQSESCLKFQIKFLKASRIKSRKMFDKLSIQFKSLQKEVILLKQDVRYSHQLCRKRSSAEVEKIVEQVQIYRQSVQRGNKMKMNDLINEIEEAKQAEHAQFEIVLKERDNLKAYVTELEDLFQKKQQQMQDATKTMVTTQVESVKRSMMEELQKQRMKGQKLEEELEYNDRQYQKQLSKAKDEVKAAVKVLTTKWIEELTKLEEENKKKQLELHRVVEKVHIVIAQSQEIKRNYESQKEETKRIRRKYESLRQEKDEQIEEFIRKLERESKHKISLQKQLRSIRSQLSRGEKNQSEKYWENENRNGGNSSVTDRQKELTEIRQLIAKTYQAVGEKPEKDTKFTRQRSPF